MEETSAPKSIRKRSFTFGEYESVIRGLDCLSHGDNLTVSTMRSMFSGGDISHGSRARSSTWHGAIVQTKQVQQQTTIQPAINYPASCTTLYSKDIFDEIITKELFNHVGENSDLIHGQEFINKSSVISQAIGKKASHMVDNNTKIIASVYIGEIRPHEVASQCLLDPAFDAFASGNFKNSSVFAVGTLFVSSCKPTMSS